jgi:hypothetical protein
MNLPEAEKKHFLGQILRLIGVAQAIHRTAPDPVLKVDDQKLKRLAIALLGSLDPKIDLLGIVVG